MPVPLSSTAPLQLPSNSLRLCPNPLAMVAPNFGLGASLLLALPSTPRSHTDPLYARTRTLAWRTMMDRTVGHYHDILLPQDTHPDGPTSCLPP